MNAEAFLAGHRDGLGAVLGIEFVAAAPDRIVARMEIGARHYARHGVVHGGVIMALADCCGAYGTVLNLPAGHTTSTIESKTNFLRAGEGTELGAEARPVHLGRTTCVWRTTLRRGTGAPIAEVTQTQIVLPDDATRPERAPTQAFADTSPPTRPRPAPSGDGSAIAADRKRQILEGASRVLTEKGYSGATIREVAAAAGMPVPTMYQYIERKEDLLLFIYESFMADYTASLRAAVEAAPTAAARLDSAIEATLANFDRNHAYIKLMFQETRELKPAARERVFALDSRYIAVWRDILEGVGRDHAGAAADAELLANFIYFLCTVWPLRYWSIGGHGRRAVAQALARFVKHGIGLPPRPKPPAGA